MPIDNFEKKPLVAVESMEKARELLKNPVNTLQYQAGGFGIDVGGAPEDEREAIRNYFQEQIDVVNAPYVAPATPPKPTVPVTPKLPVIPVAPELTGVGGAGTGTGYEESLAMQVPGQWRGVSMANPYAKDIEENFKAQKDAASAMTAAEIAQRKAEAQMASEQEAALLENERSRVARQAQFNEEVGSHIRAYEGLKAQITEETRKGVDPNRYWNSRDDGDRAAAIIAGALFGLTGQGMQYLQRLDSLVERDIRLQTEEIERRVGGLKEAAGMENNIISRLREQGMSELASISAAKATMFEVFKLQAVKMAAETGTATAQANLQKLVADIGAKVINEKQQADTLVMNNALKNAQINKIRADVELSRFEAGVKAKVALSKGAEKKPISNVLKKAYDADMAAIRVLKDMEDKVAEGGMLSRVGASISSKINPTASGEEQRTKEAAYNVLRTKYGTDLFKGALQKHEMDRLDKMIPDRDAYFKNPKAALQALRKEHIRLLKDRLAAEAKDTDVSPYTDSPLMEEPIDEVASE